MKIARRLIKFSPVLLIALVLAGWQWLNTRDESPSAELLTLVADATEPASLNDNGFAWLIGADAPANTSPVEFARERVRRPLAANESQKILFAKVPRALRCRPNFRNCISVDAEEATAVRDALANFADLEQRFAQMRAQPMFKEILPPDPRVTWSRTMVGPLVMAEGFAVTRIQHEIAREHIHIGRALSIAQGFVIARVQLAVLEQRLDDAVALLEQDNAFARRALAGSEHVHSRLAAATHLARNVLLANNLWLVAGHDLLPHQARLLKLTDPLPESSIQLAEAFDVELRGIARSLMKAGPNGPMITRGGNNPYVLAPLFDAAGKAIYLPTTTANNLLALAATQREAYQVHISKFDETRPKAEASRFKFETRWWDRVTNPVGSDLAVVAVPNFLNYQAGMHNLQAFLLLSRARLSTKPSPDANDWNQVLASLKDPYTETPLVLNTKLDQPAIRARGYEGPIGMMHLLTGGYVISAPVTFFQPLD